MAKLFPPGYVFSHNGSPVGGGGVIFYATGTTTLKNVFTDTALSVAATNSDETSPKGQPLNSDGRFSQGDMYGSGAYSVTLFDSSGGTIWSRADFETLSSVSNITTYELGSTAVAQSHPGIVTGHIIRTNYRTARISGSGSDVRFTGTTTAARNSGLIANWPFTDGAFYDTDGKQFKVIGRLDVKKFGATGDASTDDTAAFVAAIAVLPAVSDPEFDFVGGGSVWVPLGTFRITSITLKDRDWLQGEGYGSVIKQLATSDGAMITCGTDVAAFGSADAKRIRIRNLALEGVATSRVSGNYGIRGNQMFKSYIENCQVARFGDSGISFKGGSYTYIRGCDIDGNFGRGVHLDHFSADRYLTDCYVLDCTIRVNDQPGVEVDGPTNGTRISFNTIESNGLTASTFDASPHTTGVSYITNVVLLDTTYVTVDNNYFEQTAAGSEEKVQIILNGFFNNVSDNYFANQTNIILWRGTSSASYNIFSENTHGGSNPNFRNLFSTASPNISGVGNELINNNNIQFEEQDSSFSQRISVTGHRDKLLHDIQTIAGGSSLTPNLGLLTGLASQLNGLPKGNTFKITLDQDMLINLPTNVADGEEMIFLFIQDGTGGWDVTWNSQYKVSWSDTGNTLNKISTIKFVWVSPSHYQIGAQTPYV